MTGVPTEGMVEMRLPLPAPIRSSTCTSGAALGPLLVTVSVTWKLPPGVTVAGADLVMERSAMGGATVGAATAGNVNDEGLTVTPGEPVTFSVTGPAPGPVPVVLS